MRRPNSPRTERVSFRMSPVDVELMDVVAHATGRDRSEMIRELVRAAHRDIAAHPNMTAARTGATPSSRLDDSTRHDQHTAV